MKQRMTLLATVVNGSRTGQRRLTAEGDSVTLDKLMANSGLSLKGMTVIADGRRGQPDTIVTEQTRLTLSHEMVEG